MGWWIGTKRSYRGVLMPDCINENESLFELVQKKQKLTRELKEVTEKIKKLESAAKNEGATIRLM